MWTTRALAKAECNGETVCRVVVHIGSWCLRREEGRRESSGKGYLEALDDPQEGLGQVSPCTAGYLAGSR